MQCESCGEHEATIHLTQVVDGVVKKVHLCESCAAKSGFDMNGPMSITDILLGLGADAPVQKTSDVKSAGRACPRCQLRRSDFKKTGRFGCPECYSTFATELQPLLKAMHRSERHVGKVPKREEVRVRLSAEVEPLRKQLTVAIEAEQYEEAARLRDALQALQQPAENSSTGEASA